MPSPLWKCSCLYLALNISLSWLFYHWCNCRILVVKSGTCSSSTTLYPNLNFHSSGGGAMPKPSSSFSRSSFVKLFSSRNLALALDSTSAWYWTLLACSTDLFEAVRSKSEGGPRGFPVCGTKAMFRKCSATLTALAFSAALALLIPIFLFLWWEMICYHSNFFFAGALDASFWDNPILLDELIFRVFHGGE